MVIPEQLACPIGQPFRALLLIPLRPCSQSCGRSRIPRRSDAIIATCEPNHNVHSSSITELSFHGMHIIRPPAAASVTHLVWSAKRVRTGATTGPSILLPLSRKGSRKCEFCGQRTQKHARTRGCGGLDRCVSRRTQAVADLGHDSSGCCVEVDDAPVP